MRPPHNAPQSAKWLNSLFLALRLAPSRRYRGEAGNPVSFVAFIEMIYWYSVFSQVHKSAFLK